MHTSLLLPVCALPSALLVISVMCQRRVRDGRHDGDAHDGDVTRRRDGWCVVNDNDTDRALLAGLEKHRAGPTTTGTRRPSDQPGLQRRQARVSGTEGALGGPVISGYRPVHLPQQCRTSAVQMDATVGQCSHQNRVHVSCAISTS